MENLALFFFFFAPAVTETIAKATRGRAERRRLGASQINIVILQLSNKAPSYLRDIYDG